MDTIIKNSFQELVRLPHLPPPLSPIEGGQGGVLDTRKTILFISQFAILKNPFLIWSSLVDLHLMARNKLIPYRSDLKAKARKLRSESTYSEVLLWLEIKNRKLLGYQFHRQVPMLNYIADFYCHELMLAIEIDGDSHDSDEAKSYDLHRQSKLEEYGISFLRFEDTRLKMDIDKVVGEIKTWIKERDLRTTGGLIQKNTET